VLCPRRCQSREPARPNQLACHPGARCRRRRARLDALPQFFAANIRNPHTRRAYYRAAEEFLGWCASVGVPSIAAVQPVHVAAWIEASTRELAAPSVKQRLAALRHLFDWLVDEIEPRATLIGRCSTSSPAASGSTRTTI
jgi:hypothetical protein